MLVQEKDSVLGSEYAGIVIGRPLIGNSVALTCVHAVAQKSKG